MKSRYYLLIAMMIFPLRLLALDCYLAVAKNSCWANYKIVVDVLNPEDQRDVLFSITVPKDKPWARIKVACKPGQHFYARAQQFPVFWESEKGKYYYLKRYWALPKEVKKDTAAWQIPICYPDAFSGAPLPPDAKGKCQCDVNQIPPLELKK